MSYSHNPGCPVCRKAFGKEDDIVVCPECGASYHRACYTSVGDCLFADRHALDFTYTDTATAEHGGRYVICPNCQKTNPADAPACGNCGTPLSGAEVYGGEPQPQAADRPEFDAPADGEGAVPAYRRKKAEVSPDTGKFRPVDDAHLRLDEVDGDGDGEEATPMSELKKQLNLEEKLDGFSLREWLCFIGPAGPLYLFQFKKIDASRRGFSFSLPAAFFPGIFFLYRKVWGWGIVATLIKLICALPALLAFACTNGALPDFPFTAGQLELFSRYATYLDTAMSVFWGIAAATLYRRHCITRLTKLKDSFVRLHSDGAPLQEDFNLYLAQKGGVCLPAGLAAGAISVLLTYAIVLLL